MDVLGSPASRQATCRDRHTAPLAFIDNTALALLIHEHHDGARFILGLAPQTCVTSFARMPWIPLSLPLAPH